MHQVAENINDLLDSLPQTGRLVWIGMAESRRAPLVSVQQAVVRVGTGLDGEHHSIRGTGKRQVTLIQAEHLSAVAALLSQPSLPPELLRRNLVVAGINLLALKRRGFAIGEVVLQGTGPCDPCSRMEENLGAGGYNALRGHGGITATVIRGGTIRVGDPVRLLSAEERVDLAVAEDISED